MAPTTLENVVREWRDTPTPAQLAESGDLHVSPPPGCGPPLADGSWVGSHAAAGLGAVVSTLAHTLDAMGPVQATTTLLRLNQPGGLDCMSCAWPEPDPALRSRAEFCENGAKAVAAEATLRRIGADFFARHTITQLAQQTDHWLEAQGRLTTPLVRDAGAEHYRPISWAEAFALLAGEITAAGPDRCAFYTSGRTSNEAAFVYQLFARLLGTNNLPDCSNMCHESSGAALTETLGTGKGTVSLDDFAAADAILLLGQNPATNHPRMLSTLEAAARRGAAILAINPLPEIGLRHFRHPQDPLALLGLRAATPLASMFLQVRVNGDLALLRGLAKALLAAEAAAPGTVLDRGFIDAHTDGFDAYARAVADTPWTQITTASGIDQSAIEAAAAVMAGSRAVIACWAMGLTQHRNAVATLRELVNLMLLGGNIGRPGAGLCPVRGHSNVQGDRTMGITEKPGPEFLSALGRRFDFTPPARHGLDVVGTIAAMADGQLDVFFALGGNFVSAAPDTLATAAAMARCRLTAHVATKLNRSHLTTGQRALILPCLGRTEVDRQAKGPQFVTVENSMSVVSASRGHLPPASDDLLSEVAIIAGLATATLGPRVGGSATTWDQLAADYDRIRQAISQVVPGFEDFASRIRQPGGFTLPNMARQRQFATAAGAKARFTVNALSAVCPLPGQLVLMTLRSHDQFNTTIYGLEDRYRGIHGGRRVVLLNAADMAAAGLAAGDRLTLVSQSATARRVAAGFVAVPYNIPTGCAAAYFPEANPLVPADSFADISRTPTSKSVVITLQRESP